MGRPKRTQISGFYLYVSTARYRHGSELSFRDYAPIADLEYQKLTEDQKEKWKNRARSLRVEEIGRLFRLCDAWVKKNNDPKMLETRENSIRMMVMECWDLAL